MIILKGEYSYFNLSSLLRLLYSNKITGHLTLTRVREKIEISFLNGKIVGVQSSDPKQDPLENLVDSTVWLQGEFCLETLSEEDVTRNLTVPSDQVILLLAKKEKIFKGIKENLPSLDAVLVMNPECKSGEIRLQPDEWNYLSKVDGKRTLQDLVYALDMNELSVFAITVKLLQKGILAVVEQEVAPDVTRGETPLEKKEKVKKDESAVSEPADTRLEKLEKIFTRYVGPMASIILDETVETLALEKSRLYGGEISRLIEKLSLEIDSEEERRQFVHEAEESFKNPGNNL